MTHDEGVVLLGKKSVNLKDILRKQFLLVSPWKFYENNKTQHYCFNLSFINIHSITKQKKINAWFVWKAILNEHADDKYLVLIWINWIPNFNYLHVRNVFITKSSHISTQKQHTKFNFSWSTTFCTSILFFNGVRIWRVKAFNKQLLI